MTTRGIARAELSSLPTFLVIGAQRAGTTLLHELLASHPEIYVPRQRKELHYFDRHYHRGLAWYGSYFPPRSAADGYRAIGETTPDYLAVPEAAPRIASTLPGCRLIVIVRNPVERAYSWYQYCRRNQNEQRDLQTFLARDPLVLERGLYADQIGRVAASCRGQPILVLVYEELLCAPSSELGRLARFLDLRAPFADASNVLRCKVNSSEAPRLRRSFALARRASGFLLRHDVNWPVRVAKNLGLRQLFGSGDAQPPLTPALRSWLEDYYADDVIQLSSFLQRDLRIWWSRRWATERAGWATEA